MRHIKEKKEKERERERKLTDLVFLNEFPRFFVHCILLRGKLIILGDFDVHFHCRSNSITSKTPEILLTFNVVQAVKQSTHMREHNYFGLRVVQRR